MVYLGGKKRNVTIIPNQQKNMAKKILFIEDESALHQALTPFFEEAGYTMLSAFDGEEGIRLAKKEKPDLILLDLILPKKDGFEVLQELKENEETKKIPVVVLTNLGEEIHVERVLALGAMTYLVKTNYRPEEMIEKIKEVLQQ